MVEMRGSFLFLPLKIDGASLILNIFFINFNVTMQVLSASVSIQLLFTPLHFTSLFSPHRDLLKLASSKLAPLIGQGTPYAGPKGDEKEILELLKFFQYVSPNVSF